MSAKLLIRVTENKDGLNVELGSKRNWFASKEEEGCVVFIRSLLHEMLIQLKEKQGQP
jgi:hypothetical protein